MITLNSIKLKYPCEEGYQKLLDSFNKTEADDTIVTIKHLLKLNGVNDTLWIIHNCIDGELDKKRNMIADFAESVLYIWEDWAKENTPKHFDAPRKAIEICRSGNILDIDINLAWNNAHEAGDFAVDKFATAAANSARAAASSVNSYFTWWAADWAIRATIENNVYTEREKQKQIILKYFGNI